MSRPWSCKEFPMFKEKDMSMGLKFSEGKVASCEMREESRDHNFHTL